ncbi:hypothetical protein GH714_040593 [Hevea brasiliensis]|uniref:UFSP1/2/DUB catalytic domain-containing protein n=1 Tax=Hevea brasiliensis TaxID=3981 RepID=A0A6A6KX82_HEVBR|nr:hypothetical protein GH714_040593 [Hevea brasiliensis]
MKRLWIDMVSENDRISSDLKYNITLVSFLPILFSRANVAQSFGLDHGVLDVERMYLRATEAAVAQLKDSHVVFKLERLSKGSSNATQPIILHGRELDFSTDLLDIKLVDVEASQDSDPKTLTCRNFCLKSKSSPTVISVENADTIQVSVLLNRSEKSQKSMAPVAEYFPALEEARLLVVDFELDVLCYAAKDLSLMYAISKLVIPGLVDQLNSMKKAVLPKLLTERPQTMEVFGFRRARDRSTTHPIECIFIRTTLGVNVEVRRSLHLRLGLPFDRPLLRVANALDFSTLKDNSGSNSRRKGLSLLKDVHIGIPSSGVSGELSLWFKVLMNIIIIFKMALMTRAGVVLTVLYKLSFHGSDSSIILPLKFPLIGMKSSITGHWEIQQSLVEIGDKDPSFIDSREWIGAIELSFVLDKLLGVTCKIINVRSGAELPERCRELALHFENQGTPIMIGGGVLAYTLLGVDYNESSGDCAFLILDPHYTGNDEHKKIINGGGVDGKKLLIARERISSCMTSSIIFSCHRGPTWFSTVNLRGNVSANIAIGLRPPMGDNIFFQV